MRDDDREYNDDEEFQQIQAELDNESDRKQYPPFILLFLFTTIAVLFALGLSFSTISFLQNNETINSIISSLVDDDDDGKYLITYVENTGQYENGINLVNQYPTPDSVGKMFSGKNYVYNFSIIVGSETRGAYYELTAVPDKNNTLNSNYVKLFLQKNNHDVDFSYKNNKVKTFADYQKSSYDETDGVLIYSDEITEEDIKNGKIDFTMRMWVSEDAVVDENFSNKTFAVKVNTYAAFLNGEKNAKR